MTLQNLVYFFVLIFVVALLATAVVHMFFLVPYVPSRRRVAAKMVAAARLQAGETVFDLGCGDGRLLFEAERLAPKGKAPVKTIGFELAPLVFLLAWAKKILSGSHTNIRLKNFFDADLRKANVIFCYLIPHVMPRLAEKLKKECRRGTRIISNTFHIPGLTPAKVFKKDEKKGLPTIYVYKIQSSKF